MALALYRPEFWASLLLGMLVLFLIAWRRRLRWRPAWPLRASLLGIILIGAFAPMEDPVEKIIPERQVLVIDQSVSVPDVVRQEIRNRAVLWQSDGENRLVVVFGDTASPLVGGKWPETDSRSTDHAAALNLALDFLEDEQGRIILVTDGLTSEPLKANEVIKTMSLSGHTLDVIQLPIESKQDDLYLGSMVAPSSLWENTAFQAVLPIYSTRERQVALQLIVNGETEVEEMITLSSGENIIPFSLRTRNEEIMTLEARVQADSDPRLENNTSFASLRVFPAPNVLFVTENPEIIAPLTEALVGNGLEIEVMPPPNLPTSLDNLQTFQVILLHNFLAEALSESQMLALEKYVSQLGRGLIFLGGRNSYTLGGYRNTILEPMLPVRLQPPRRSQKTPVTLVLAFDRSASMAPRQIPVKPIDLAREAAIRAVETMRAEDFLGVLTYNTSPVWNVPIGLVGDGLSLQRAQDAIAQVTASGGTSIYRALDTALTDLLETPTSEARHLLLLSDGQSSDGTLEEFQDLAEFARSRGITISTIALGAEADQELMALIANAAQGRYYPVQQPADLPRIVIAESQAARSENIQLGSTGLTSGDEPHPILSGLSPAQLPLITGYNALESKSDMGAEDILRAASFPEDPVLSVWQYGLGRVVAWTSDSGEEWAVDWSAWPELGRFWSQVVQYALPDPALGPGQVDIDVRPTDVLVSAQLQTATGIPLHGLQVSFSFVGPGGRLMRFQLPQVGPGIYQATVPIPPEGAYRGVINAQRPEGEEEIEIAAPLVVNYPLEWQPPDPGIGERNIKAWTEATGGDVIDWDNLFITQETAEETALKPDEVSRRLALALLILWPIEIAIRRRWLPWR